MGIDRAKNYAFNGTFTINVNWQFKLTYIFDKVIFVFESFDFNAELFVENIIARNVTNNNFDFVVCSRQICGNRPHLCPS